MSLHDLTHNTKAETGTTLGPGIGHIGLSKSSEHPAAELFGYSRALVDDRDPDALNRAQRLDFDS